MTSRPLHHPPTPTNTNTNSTLTLAEKGELRCRLSVEGAASPAQLRSLAPFSRGVLAADGGGLLHSFESTGDDDNDNANVVS